MLNHLSLCISLMVDIKSSHRLSRFIHFKLKLKYKYLCKKNTWVEVEVPILFFTYVKVLALKCTQKLKVLIFLLLQRLL